MPAGWPGFSVGSTGWPTGCASRVTEPSAASSGSTRSCMRSAMAKISTSPTSPLHLAREELRAIHHNLRDLHKRSAPLAKLVLLASQRSYRRRPAASRHQEHDRRARAATQARCQQPVARLVRRSSRARQVHREPRQPGADHQGAERQGEQPRLRPQEGSAVQYAGHARGGGQRLCASSDRNGRWRRSSSGKRSCCGNSTSFGVSVDPLAARQVVPPRSPRSARNRRPPAPSFA